MFQEIPKQRIAQLQITLLYQIQEGLALQGEDLGLFGGHDVGRTGLFGGQGKLADMFAGAEDRDLAVPTADLDLAVQPDDVTDVHLGVGADARLDEGRTVDDTGLVAQFEDGRTAGLARADDLALDADGIQADLTTWDHGRCHDLAVFEAFIRLWYNRRTIQGLFFGQSREESIYRGIVSLLAGYTDRPDNVFLQMLAKRVATAG